jgi:hypothetical protein
MTTTPLGTKASPGDLFSVPRPPVAQPQDGLRSSPALAPFFMRNLIEKAAGSPVRPWGLLP